MSINARNLAAALSYMGADVESALLKLTAIAPSLDSRVRAALFPNAQTPRLRNVADRGGRRLVFVDNSYPRWTCAMHAADAVCTVLDDADLVKYLQSQFPEYNPEVLVEV